MTGLGVEVYYHRWTGVAHGVNLSCMAATKGFRPTEEDARIIRDAMRGGEGTSDVIRRALRLLEREEWVSRARSDAGRLADEDLTTEEDAW